MNWTPMHWGAEALWRQLEPLLPGLSVEVLRETVSTNTALLERARATADLPDDAVRADVRRSVESMAFGRRAADVQPCLLVAEQQTGGRGRHGRNWQSSPGASLTFSLGLQMHASHTSGLSLAIGVALCEALSGPPGAPRLGLKWPNDLWLMDTPQQGRKLGGILIETVSAGEKRLVVIGIGLNVTPLPVAEFGTGMASLQEIDAAATPPATLMRIALPLVRALRQFDEGGFDAFAQRYAGLDVLAGQPVRTSHAEASEGVACGVSAEGALQVRGADGAVTSVGSGEVSVRLDAGARSC